jgi:hypothetical protein
MVLPDQAQVLLLVDRKPLGEVWNHGLTIRTLVGVGTWGVGVDTG